MLKRRALRGMLNRLRKTVILIVESKDPYRLQRSPVEVLSR
jgi:hypothetical protein